MANFKDMSTEVEAWEVIIFYFIVIDKSLIATEIVFVTKDQTMVNWPYPQLNKVTLQFLKFVTFLLSLDTR